MFKKISRTVIAVVLSMMFIVQPVFAQKQLPPKHDFTIIASNGEIFYGDIFEKVEIANSPANGLKADALLAASGCKNLTNGINIYDNLNLLVARYSQTVNWCYNGSTITSVSHTKNPVSYTYIYKYNGLVGHLHNGGQSSTTYRAYSVAWFCERLENLCFTHFYPAVDQTVRGDGTYSGSATMQ